MRTIRVAIAGVGNCASNFIQGLEYYKKHKESSVGLMNRIAGGYDIADIEVVAAFDIAENKVGRDISEAIFIYPNCTEKISEVPYKNVIVQKGPTLDGWDKHFSPFFKVSNSETIDVSEVLIKEKVDVLVIMIPTGSKEACYAYIHAAINAGVGIVNGIPVLACHDNEIIQMAQKGKVPIIGDDFKSQIGGTILHHTLMDLLQKRGVHIDRSYQLNYAGNMDFLNLMSKRGEEKHKSKKRGIKAGCNNEIDLDVNVSYLANQDDEKTCNVFIEGENFGGCKVTLETKLTVIDSANSSGVVCDAIRCIMVAKERQIYGILEGPSAYYMKSPNRQIDDLEAYTLCKNFLDGDESINNPV